MKNKIYGFLEYDKKEYSFICENGVLTLLPNNFNELQVTKWNSLKRLNSNNNSKKWIENIPLEGVTSTNKGIKIFVPNSPRIENGYFFFEIEYIFMYDIDYENNENMNPIYGIGFKGKECNYFYDVAKYIETNFQIEQNRFKKFTTELTSKPDANLGSFKWKNYSVKIKGSFSWLKGNDTYSPLVISSILLLDLSRKCNDIEKLLELIEIQSKFFKYVTYRENISYDEIYVYTRTSDGLRRKCGEFIFFEGIEEEKDIKRLKQIMNSDCFENHMGLLYQQIHKNHIYFQHIPSNSNEKNKYSQSRILSVLIAFENNYDFIYKDAKKMSTEYEMAKKQTLEFLDCQILNSSGKIKKKLKSLKTSITKLSLGYSDRLEYALKDNYNILEPFIGKIYKVKTKRRILDSCAKRCGNVRNNIAHGNLNFKFKPINVSDIQLLELLIYSMQLKKIGVKDIIIQQKINALFGFKLYFE